MENGWKVFTLGGSEIFVLECKPPTSGNEQTDSIDRRILQLFKPLPVITTGQLDHADSTIVCSRGPSVSNWDIFMEMNLSYYTGAKGWQLLIPCSICNIILNFHKVISGKFWHSLSHKASEVILAHPNIRSHVHLYQYVLLTLVSIFIDSVLPPFLQLSRALNEINVTAVTSSGPSPCHGPDYVLARF